MTKDGGLLGKDTKPLSGISLILWLKSWEGNNMKNVLILSVVLLATLI